MLTLFALLNGFFYVVYASNVLYLDKGNFTDHVGKGKPGLVEFFAPWCGHCKNLAPTYEQVADAYSHQKDKVYIAKVDADGDGREVGQEYGVTGFPTLFWVGPDGKQEKYEGQRDLDAFVSFITQKTGIKSNIKPPPPPATLILDTHTFDDTVLDTSKDVLVAFTAPWCGHCKKMKPELEKVAETFKSESKCIVANVDADAQPNAPLAQKYEISSFPTIIFFPKDNKEGVPYQGGRSEADFVNYLNENCGTSRAVGGGLSDKAGRLAELDTLASKFFSATRDARNSVYEEAALVANDIGSTSQHYLRVMQKAINGTEDYLEKEAARLASILKKKTLAPAKLDEIKIKANIIASFMEQKLEEVEDAVEGAAEAVESAINREKAEL